MRIILSGFFTLLMANTLTGQTIHIDSLDYFVGCFALNDTADHESADLSSFIEWKILNPRPNYQWRDIRSINYDKDKLWVWHWHALGDQECEIKGGIGVYEYEQYRFFLLFDYFPQEYKIGILTIWQMVAEDSIRYIKGHFGEFNMEREGYGSVELVSVFPDTSIMLIVKLEEPYTGVHKFFVGDINDGFKPFFESEQYRTNIFPQETGKIISYDFNELEEQLYQAVEIIKHFTGISTYDYEYGYSDFGIPKLDSAETRILNLWEMAQEIKEIDQVTRNNIQAIK